MTTYERMQECCHQVLTAMRFQPGRDFHDEGWGWESPVADLLENTIPVGQADEVQTPPLLRVRAA